MAVEVLNGHFAYSPRIVGRRLTNDCPGLSVGLVEGVDVLDENAHPRARTALRLEGKEEFDLLAPHASQGRRIAPLPFLLDSEVVHGVTDRGCHIPDRHDPHPTPQATSPL